MVKNILIVALGGALGSVARYLLSSAIQEHARSMFPAGTLAVNVTGCVIIGFITGLAASHGAISPQMRLILVTGFCGGFTTFSTFANETLAQMQSGCTPQALLYVAASIVLGLCGAFGGLELGRAC